MSRESLTNSLALIVAGVWAIVAITSLIISDYTALATVTPVMLVVTGFLFGAKGTTDKDKTK
jgi:ATP/ADP translocase